MNEIEIFSILGGLYLDLIRPELPIIQKKYCQISKVLSFVDIKILKKLILGESWRERVVGVFLSTLLKEEKACETMVESILTPRGIAITPTFASLTVFSEKKKFKINKNFFRQFKTEAFNGESFWAASKMLGKLKKKAYFAGPGTLLFTVF